MYRGEEATVRGQVAVAQAGPVQIELIQQLCDRPSIFRDWSHGGTSAFHQLATVTPDYDGKVAYYQQLGYELAAENMARKLPRRLLRHRRGFRLLHRGDRADAGVPRQPAQDGKASEAWDGTDPVRLLTAEGRVQ